MIQLAYMLPRKEQIYETESYVSTPPALIITDEANNVWTLGFSGSVSGGEFCYDVLRNGMPTGERANRIERRNGRVRIFGPEGWKIWTGKVFI
jgi:hypothetical protein